MSVTPESDKTMQMTGQAAAEGPTPKNEFKKPFINQKQFMSPTDAMVSPCTQKLITSRRMPRGNQRPKAMYVHSHLPPSKLANKENEQKAALKKTASDPQRVTKPLETNV